MRTKGTSTHPIPNEAFHPVASGFSYLQAFGTRRMTSPTSAHQLSITRACWWRGAMNARAEAGGAHTTTRAFVTYHVGGGTLWRNATETTDRPGCVRACVTKQRTR